MSKLIMFDYDRTLAPVDGIMQPEAVAMLLEIERRGYTVAICSGRPIMYLCGVLRQIGLQSPILLGENGMFVQFGTQYPPRYAHMLEVAPQSIEAIQYVREQLLALFDGNIWSQHNQLMYTPYPTTTEQWDAIDRFIVEHAHIRDWLDIYKHFDCYDFMPRGITKGSGLQWLASYLGVDMADTIAVGDGVNDYPMFAVAGLALGVNVAQKQRVHTNFDCTNSALQYLLQLLP